MSKVCQHCGSSDIDTDASRGDSVCTNCGSVLDDQIIVSEVQFEENSRGGTSVMGQFISSDSGKPSISNVFGKGMGRESRTVTLAFGKKRLEQLGAQLKLNHHCINTAYNFFRMAVMRNLTRGRKTMHVTAACLYLVCRTEGTPHMLLDFSDILQVNVFALGRTYQQFAKALCINTRAIDPCMYIPRFAHKLEFGDKTHEVTMTALRIVSRMKRDWMCTGRRPSGLCGAALLVAARLHDFNRTEKDIIRIVKICSLTLKKRLKEFEETPSSALTIDEFQSVDLEEEANPPSFQSVQKTRIEMLEDPDKMKRIANEITTLQSSIDNAIDEANERKFKRYLTSDSPSTSKSNPEQQEIFENILSDTSNSKFEELFGVYETITEVLDDGKVSQEDGEEENETEANFSDYQSQCPRPSLACLGISESLLNQNLDPETEVFTDNPQETENPSENDELDLTGINDEEIDAMILDDEEVKMKTFMWTKLNAEYIKEQEIKKQQELEKNEANADKPKRARAKKRKNEKTPTTTHEAIEMVVNEKKISNKINYEVLRGLSNKPVSVDKGKNEAENIVKEQKISEPSSKPQPARKLVRFAKPKIPVKR